MAPAPGTAGVVAAAARNTSPRFSAHIGYMFSDLGLEQRFAAAAEAGFPLVEHPAPYALSARRVRELLDAEGLGFAQLATPLGDPAKGEKGLACLPGRADEFRASLASSFDFAASIGCRLVHIQSGIAPPGAEPRALWETYVENLAHGAELAAGHGLTVLIEAIGKATVAGYYLSDPRMAVRAISAVGRTNIALLFDVFHAVNDGIDPFHFIRAHADLIAHVHIADHPGRHEPGTGRIDFAALFSTLDDLAYPGAIGCEYIPSGDTSTGLGWLDYYR